MESFKKGKRLAGVKTKRQRKAIITPTADSTVNYIVTPKESGPYKYDLNNTADKFRQDITNCEGPTLMLVLTFVNINDNNRPISNSRVNICYDRNKDNQYNNIHGLQMTDMNGQVMFKMSSVANLNDYIRHIQFEIYLNAAIKATSKLPVVSTNHIMGDAEDGYIMVMTIGVDVPNKGIITLTPETGGQFILDQNAPNPVVDKTTIGFTLLQDSKVGLDIYDMEGKKIESLINESMDAGAHTVQWNPKNLPGRNYLYQLSIENKDGIYGQIKVMTRN